MVGSRHMTPITYPTFDYEESPDYAYEVLSGPSRCIHAERLKGISARELLIPLRHFHVDQAEWTDFRDVNESGAKELFQKYHDAILERLQVRHALDCADTWHPTGGKRGYQLDMFDASPDFRLKRNGAPGVVGSYVEDSVAAILNATCCDISGKHPDIVIDRTMPGVFVESKSGRLGTNTRVPRNGRNSEPVSKAQVVVKRSQIIDLLEHEEQMGVGSYYAFSSYDLPQGTDLTLTQYAKKHSDIFSPQDYSQFLEKIVPFLHEHIHVKSVYIVPTAVVAYFWNRRVDQIWPLSQFAMGKPYRNRDIPVYQKYQTKHIADMVEFMEREKIPEYRYAFMVEGKPCEVRSFGCRFAPDDRGTLKVPVMRK